jgi:amidase
VTSRNQDEMSSDLWRWSATSLRDAIRRGEVSATEVLTAHLDRCDDVNGSINALISVSA